MEQFYYYRNKTDVFKKKLWLLALFSLLSWSVNAQCPPGNLTFTTQAQVDAFATNYPNCTAITGNLIIQGNITDLSPLSTLTSVGGYLNISQNTVLTNLDGLSNLTSVGGYLNINNNAQLSNINGLSNLTSVGGYLSIQHLPIITNLDGLSSLASIGGSLTISNNALLANISGIININPTSITSLTITGNSKLIFCNIENVCDYLAGTKPKTIHSNGFHCSYAGTVCSPAQCPTGNITFYSQTEINNFAINYPNCTAITGNLIIQGNNITDLSPLSTLTSVEGYILIQNNSVLTNLNGLSNLTSVGGYLDIFNNSQLSNINGLSNLTSVGGYLSIYYNYQLSDINGLSNLTSVGGYLKINNNAQLSNINGLSNLTSVGGNLSIQHLPIITNLDGLSSLASIGGVLTISNNALLANISGIIDINPTSITSLTITGNSKLIFCNIENVCDYLAGTKPKTIHSNGFHCSNAATVCSPAQCPTGNITFYSQAQVDAFATNYPNCTAITGNLIIQGNNITDLSPLSTLTSVGGYLNISQNTVLTNLDGLSNLTSVGGYLDIYNNSQLSNINGLSNLTSVGEYLYITNNAQLSNINGLSNLTSVGGNLIIANNPQLTNLDGLSNLTQIGGYLYISTNSQLTNLDGLSNLTQIGGNLDIYSNSQLTNLDGLSNLTQIGGNLNIYSNSQLTNLDGLSALESINGYLRVQNNAVLIGISGLQNIDPATILSTNSLGLYIQNNPLLSVCNLDNFCTYLAGSGLRTISGNAGDCVSVTAVTTACTTSQEPQCPTGDVILTSQTQVNDFGTNYPNCTEITGYLQISGSDITDLSPLSNIIAVTGNLYAEHSSQLTSLQGLHNVASVGGGLSIYNNPQLNSVQALSNITSLGGFLSIYNTNLSSLEGLHNITAIDGGLSITSNAVLTDISALENIDPETITDTGLYIAGNSSLSVCDLDNFCTFLQGSGTRTISGNAGNCYESAVTNACLGVISYCIPVAENTSVSYGIYINSFTVTGGETNINNTNSGFSTGGYGNFSDNHSASQMAGESLSFSAVPGNESFRKGLRIWVDWNNDGVFDNTASNSEIVYFSPNVLYETHNGSFTIPSDKPAGNYRMRVMMKYESTIFDPCEINNGAPYYSYFYGETEDYTLTVLEPLPCSSPTALNISNLTMESVAINWTSTGSLFDIEWGIQGFTQGTGTQETGITTTSYILSGLDAVIPYDFYIRQDCNGSSDEYSYWVKYTFSINNYCIPVDSSYSEMHGIFINSFTTIGGETNINNLDSGFSANGYGNFSAIHSVSQFAGESISFSAVPVNEDSNKSFRAWVDWNKDGVFANDNSEIVYASPNMLLSTHTGSFEIPADKTPGNYRMRIIIMHNTHTIDPCETGFYGEAEDYTLTVLNNTSVSCNSYTIWNGTSWSNGEPDSNKKAIIEGNLTITTTLTACELLLNSGVLTVNSSALLTVNGEIVNTQNENNFIVHNDANVIQVEDVENTGAITVKRNAVIKHLDYSTWSSPVLGQKLKAFSPYTLNNRIRIYDAVANTWKIVENPETTDFASGAGYMFRAPNVNDDGFYPNAYTWTGNFKGVPQNGAVTYNFSNATGAGLYQSLGNPYPSNISRASFHTANPQIGTLHFWTNTNAPVNGVYQGNNYATINRSGDAVMVTSNIQGGQNSAIPNGYIAVGQGFVAQTNGVINQAVFTNSMRTAQNATFLRSSNNEKHRFWLNLSKGTQEHNQMLVSYNEEATNEVDFGIDSELFGYTGSALYSLINQNQTKYVIQGRALPFTDIDVVQLGFKATEAGIYKVSLSDFDGTFAENQNIYIKDNQTSTQHNLKLSNYEFASLEGTFDDRFEIVYTDSVLDVSNPEYQNTWIVYKQNDLFHIQTQGFEMKEVMVYDMLGRIVYSAKAEGNNHQINGLDTNGVYIVKIITNNNIVLNKKVQ